MNKEEYAATLMFPLGEYHPEFDRYFTGVVYIQPVSDEQIHMSNLTFEPGCRNHWHVHKAEQGGGQMLLCTGGRGWYQAWGEEAVPMTPGTVVHIPPGVKHWHGAANDSWFSHLAIEIEGVNTGADWYDPVSEEEYQKLK